MRFLCNKSKQEIDFLILKNNLPWLPFEIKTSQNKLTENWRYFMPQLPIQRGIQVVKTPNVMQKITTEYAEILIISAEIFLAQLV